MNNTSGFEMSYVKKKKEHMLLVKTRDSIRSSGQWAKHAVHSLEEDGEHSSMYVIGDGRPF